MEIVVLLTLLLFSLHVALLVFRNRLSLGRILLFAFFTLFATLAVTLVRYRISVINSGEDEWTSDTFRYLTYGIAHPDEFWAIAKSLLGTDGTAGIVALSSISFTLLGKDWFAVFFFGALFGLFGSWFFSAALLNLRPDLPVAYLYVIALFPSPLYWSSSFGKESFTIFAIGMATFALSRIRFFSDRSYNTSSPTISPRVLSISVQFLVAFVIAWMVRTQVAVLLVAAFAISALIYDSRRRRVQRTRLVLFPLLAGVLLALWQFGAIDDYFGFFDDISSRLSRTSIGASQIAVDRPDGIIGTLYGLILVLTRPFPWEAGLGGFGSSFDIPLIWLTLHRVWNYRRSFNGASVPSVRLIFFSLLVVAGLFIALVSYGNLGLLVRMRSQVIGPLLVIYALLPTLKVPAHQASVEDALKRTAQKNRQKASL